MPHDEAMMVKTMRVHDKIRGFNVRILDDGTFILSMQNEDYMKNKEYSYESLDKLITDLRKDFGKKKESVEKKDNLTK